MQSATPLSPVDKAITQGLISSEITKRIVRGFQALTKSIAAVEAASGIPYPRYFVEPILVVVQSGVETSQLGIIYARNRPVETGGGLEIVIEFSGALLAFGSRPTIEAVTAHEFTHYLELVGKFSTFHLVSDTASETLFEATYSDYGRLIDPTLVFGRRSRLTKLIEKKMPSGLRDPALEKKTLKLWLEKKMPAVRISPQANMISLSASQALRFRAEPKATELVSQILRTERP